MTMGKFRTLFLTLACLLLSAATALAQVAILCYHEVDHPHDAFAVSQSTLESHIAYLKKNGYHFVTLQEYLDYTDGKLKLPDKSVMITFDDGYQSFYTKAYPLLQKYQVPAMLAIVTSWTDGEGLPSDVRATATWDELREMEKSGLVTLVSHTHALHKQLALDPQGDRNGIAGYRLYLNGRYESEEEYHRRLENDMAAVQTQFQKQFGHPSRAMVWPYGIYSGASIQAARDHGMKATFLLDGGVNDPTLHNQIYAKRMIITSDTDVKRLQKLLTKDHDTWDSKPLRMAQIDLDNLIDPDANVLKRRILDLTEQLQASKIQLVALQAFADPDGDGNVDKVYFYNKEIPVAADAFNTVALNLQQQGFTVVAWLPTLTYQSFIAKDGSNAVQAPKGKGGWYRRLSPFDTQSLDKVKALYRDLGRYTSADGVLLQDDLYLNDFEDQSSYGKTAYTRAFGEPFPAKMTEAQQARWTKLKTRQLNAVAGEMLAAFKESRPNAITLRDIYDAAVTEPESETWFAQNYQDCLKNYNYTVVMAYPQMDKEDNPTAFLKQVAKGVKAAGGNTKTIVKIQTYDWDKEKWLDGKTFRDELQTLKKAGIRNRGTYPQSFVKWSD